MASASSGNSTLTDPTRRKPLPEIREEYDYARREWSDVRIAAADDMKNVAGDPWDDDDKEIREGRPTIAPDEMTQYRNQVTNALRRNPRGVKFTPAGQGASQKTAEFYEGKMREIEYRSRAADHYIAAADNVLQRSYGAFRVGIHYAQERDINPDIYIDGFPDPDAVLPDPTIKKRHGQDMGFCFVLETMRRSAFRKAWPGAKLVNFSDFADRYKDWVVGPKMIQVAEHWRNEPYARPLHAVVLGPNNEPAPDRPKPIALYEDEIARHVKGGMKVHANRHIRDVQYPKIIRRITNGLEILEKIEWDGKYIPIVLLFGPTLWKPEGGQTKRVVLSMTRFGKVPWKSYCYACSQELEVLGMFPKAAALAEEGQVAGHEDEWEEALYRPKSILYYKGRVPGMKETEERLPPPQRLNFVPAEYLAAIEEVKEGFRRAIQSAMGSNFLPTEAQKINDKSGVALDKIDEAAAEGTYHFVTTYEGAIQWGGQIIEDLMDRVHDYTGETSILGPKGPNDARTARINDPDDPDAFTTSGAHIVTVTTAPSTDSQYDKVEKFLDGLLGNIQVIAGIIGPQGAAYVLSQAVKMRNMGVLGDELSDFLLPPQFKALGGDGKPQDPRLASAMAQIQTLQQQLGAAQQQIKSGAALKQVEWTIRKQIEEMKVQAASADKAADRAVKLEVAAIQAKIETWSIVLEELHRIGGMSSDAEQRLHDAGQATLERTHDSIERAKDRSHEKATQETEHQHAKALAAAGIVADQASQERGAQIDSAAVDQKAVNDAAVSSMRGGGGEGTE